MMWNRIAFKATGKANFKSNYWVCVAVSVLYMLVFGNLITSSGNFGSFGANLSYDLQEFTNLTQIYGIQSEADLAYAIRYFVSLVAPYLVSGTILSYAITLLVAHPYEVGASRFYLESTTFHPTPFSRVAKGFTVNFGNVVLTQFLRKLFIFLWSLLFLIPGIVRAYGYFAVPFILAENPHLDHKRVLDLSRQMTMGYKGHLFVTDLSFLGWNILSAFTFGILGIFYVNPYYHATQAELYRFLRAQAMEQGITSPAELPGMNAEI